MKKGWKRFISIALILFMVFRIDENSVMFANAEEISSKDIVKITFGYFVKEGEEYKHAQKEVDVPINEGQDRIYHCNWDEWSEGYYASFGEEGEKRYGDIDYWDVLYPKDALGESDGTKWDGEEDLNLSKPVCILVAGHDHSNAKHVDAIDGTDCKTEGTKAHFECSCGFLFEDNGNEEMGSQITEDDLKSGETGKHKLILEQAAVDPTCEGEGFKEYYRCEVCNDYFWDAEGTDEIPKGDVAQAVISPLEHSYQDYGWDGNNHWQICGRDGCNQESAHAAHTPGGKSEKGEVRCTECNYLMESDTPHQHVGDLIPAKDSTCTEAGNIAYYVCRDADENYGCFGKYFEDEACTKEIEDKESVKRPLADHAYGEEWSNDEANHWHECAICGDKKDIGLHVSNGGHTETEAEKCTTCGYDMNPVMAHQHSLTRVPFKAASCTEDGNIEYYVCAPGNGKNGDYCGKYFKDADGTEPIAKENVKIPAGHAIFEVPREEATCGKEGTEAFYQCSNCNRNFFDQGGTREIASSDDWAEVVIQPLGHNFGTEWKQDKDNHWHECSDCHVQQDFGAHNPNGPATETENSVCTVCNYTIAAALGHQHTPVLVEGKAATCVEAGWETYYVCSCGKYFADATALVEITGEGSVTISATGHHYGVWEVIMEPSGTEDGLQERVCPDCGNVESMVLSATGEDAEDDEEPENDADNSAVTNGAGQIKSPKTGDDFAADNAVGAVFLLALAMLSGAEFCVVKIRKKA